MNRVQVLRVVVASPSDVQAERDAVETVAAELNRGIATDRGLRLDVIRWETDAHPGFHAGGPQGLIDPILRIEVCDLLIGIFWKRFGTPTADGKTGAEHEFGVAYDAWKRSGRPQIMVYFNQKPATPRSLEETQQWGKVLEFRRDFPKEGLWWPYNGKVRFEKLAREHLTRFVLQHGLHPASDLPPAAPPLPARADFTAARRQYLRCLAAKTGDLPLLGLDPGAANALSRRGHAPSLTDVYIALDTLAREDPDGSGHRGMEREMVDEHGQPLSALAVFGKSRHLVLLGDPGSGKSTLVNYLVHCLARIQSEPEDALPWKLEGLPEDWQSLLPVRIVLREMAAWIRQSETEREQAALLEDYLRHWLAEIGQSDVLDLLLRCLRDGEALLLLDGWDEVSAGTQALPKLRRMLDALPDCFRDTPQLITCRVRSYEEEAWRLDARRWLDVRLNDFDDEKIDAFVEAWYRHLAARPEVTDAASRADRLKAAVRRPDLRRMAGNPLLLTVMAIDHADKGELPDARSVVYEDVVELLLWKWRQPEKPGEEAALPLRDLLQRAGKQERDFITKLGQIAYAAHFGASDHGDLEQSADIPEMTLRKRFVDLGLDWNGADVLLRTIKLRAGLLIPSGSDSYTFPHRTFQEYLAACHLCSQGDVVGEVVEVARRGAYWREVVLLAVNRLVYQNRETARPFGIVRSLCPLAAPGPEEEARWRQVALAGECLREIGPGRATEEHDIALVDHVRLRLAELVGGGLLDVSERVAAGNVLGALGDLRDLGEMILIPAGEFVMGENPPRKVYLNAYRIRKYPVTNQEYAQFVAATGHRVPDHWRGGLPAPEMRNHPVMNVSWEDAQSYCAWAGMSLPTEAQWEKAARGTDGRVYPWGNDWDASRCNNWETGPKETSPVGCFPSGASPYECLDMAGNVWEWCADWYDEDYYRQGPIRNPAGPKRGVGRVLRGGAWGFTGPVYFRAANRDWIALGDWDFYVGFRCVARPDSC